MVPGSFSCACRNGPAGRDQGNLDTNHVGSVCLGIFQLFHGIPFTEKLKQFSACLTSVGNRQTSQSQHPGHKARTIEQSRTESMSIHVLTGTERTKEPEK